MFLKSLELIGFKSFADKTHLDFTEGITGLLGPNGCGKSNIVDSIKWVLGEQSTKTLRAARMEDVIFNGNDKRKPMPFAEVTLVIDNSNHQLPNDAAEIEIKRRIFRNGDSNEYYLNRQLCNRRDIRGLFFDTGVGKSAYSILEQGKIDQILLQSPEERRSLFEEAAGISRFKAESDEAEKKLMKCDENIVQVDTILKETKRTYESRKTQAEKAIQFRGLRDEQFKIEVDVQLSSIKTYLQLTDEWQKKLQEANLALTANQEKTKEVIDTMSQTQESMRQHGQVRIQLQLDLKELTASQSAKNDKLDYLTTRFRELCKEKESFQEKAQLYKEKIENAQEEIDDKNDALSEMDGKIDKITKDIADNQASLEQTKDLIAKEENAIGESEKANVLLDDELVTLQQKLTDLTDVIVDELDEKLKSSGYRTEDKLQSQRAFQKKLAAMRQNAAERAAFYGKLSGTNLSLDDLVRNQQKTIADFDELSRLFDTFLSHEPTFLDDLVAPEGIITEKHAVDEKMSDIRKKMGDTKERITQLQDEHRRLSSNMESFQQAINDQTIAKTNYLGQKNTLSEVLAQLMKSLTDQQYQYSDALNAQKSVEDRIYDTQEDIRKVEEEFKDGKARIDESNQKLEDEIALIDDLQEQIRKMQAAQSDAINEAQTLRTTVTTLQTRIQEMGPQIQTVYTNFFETYGKSLKEYEGRLNEQIEDYSVLKNRLDTLKKQISSLGSINQMAEDEFNEVKTQYEFLTKQLDDLNKAKSDLVAVVNDIKTRSAELFTTTYKQISDNFQEMFRKMFGGGKAELILLDPENVLTSGIDIFAQPPGKKMVSLSLLSGGERSMTAMALLFATYLVKPSPFCILDEIDAALDDRNIGSFLSVLEEFSKTSQFIIITHNKHTVLGASSMLGVTQMEAGVSTTVSYKLVKEAGKPVIMDESNQKVDFTDDGVRK